MVRGILIALGALIVLSFGLAIWQIAKPEPPQPPPAAQPAFTTSTGAAVYNQSATTGGYVPKFADSTVCADGTTVVQDPNSCPPIDRFSYQSRQGELLTYPTGAQLPPPPQYDPCAGGWQVPGHPCGTQPAPCSDPCGTPAVVDPAQEILVCPPQGGECITFKPAP